MATIVAAEIAQDKVFTFRIVPGTLEQFRESLAEGGPRITCFEGSLTLVSPGETHETSDRRLGLLIIAICEALKIPISPLGATYHGMAGDTGYEPDESYYVQSHGTASAGQVPDLAIEVVVTNPATKALASGELLGIPEMWVWDVPRHVLTFHHLVQRGRGKGTYRHHQQSLAFPFLTPAAVLGRVGERVDAATFDAGAFSTRNRAWAKRVLLPLHRESRKNG